MGRCKGCHRAKMQRWRAENYEEYRTANRRHVRADRERLRLEVLNAYSDDTLSCACCGTGGHMWFLCIDHIDNSGAAHRRELFGDAARGASDRLYRWLRNNNFPAGYQVLCWTCNMAKNLNGGVCPHELMANTPAG
jgi:hypothetical protein